MSDKQSKRAPGGSPALSFLLAVAKAVVVIATVLVLVIVALVSWGHYRPDLLIDPINRHVHLAYLQCRDAGQCPTKPDGLRSMVPDIFAVGEPRDRVIGRLRAAGFEEWVVDGSNEHYRRIGAAQRPLFCSKYYNIDLLFDAKGLLASADSTFTGTPSCL